MKVNQIEGTSAQSKWHFLPHSSALRAIAVGMLGVKVASGCGSLKKTKKKKERKKSKNANLLAFNLKEKQKQTKNKNRKEKRRIAETRIARIRLAHSTKTRNPKGPGTSKHRDSVEPTLIMCTKLCNNNSGPQQQMRHINERIMSSVELPAMDGWMDGSRAKSHLIPQNVHSKKRNNFENQFNIYFLKILKNFKVFNIAVLTI